MWWFVGGIVLGFFLGSVGGVKSERDSCREKVRVAYSVGFSDGSRARSDN